MNFISHYHLLENKENTLRVFGNVWPDFQRGFSKIYNTELKNNSSFNSSDIGDGVMYHLHLDAYFHSHTIFLSACKTIENTTSNHGLAHPKMSFTSHILFELLIDYYVLQVHTETMPSFYDHFNEKSIQLIKIELSNFLDEVENDKIICNFKSFIKNRYAQYLLSNDGVIETLNALIGKRIGVQFDAIKWYACVNDCFIAVETDIKAILMATKNELLKHD